ncbi:MAG: hypothetical protein ACK5QX_01610, partial [bacterium]
AEHGDIARRGVDDPAVDARVEVTALGDAVEVARQRHIGGHGGIARQRGGCLWTRRPIVTGARVYEQDQEKRCRRAAHSQRHCRTATARCKPKSSIGRSDEPHA